MWLHIWEITDEIWLREDVIVLKHGVGDVVLNEEFRREADADLIVREAALLSQQAIHLSHGSMSGCFRRASAN